MEGDELVNRLSSFGCSFSRTSRLGFEDFVCLGEDVTGGVDTLESELGTRCREPPVGLVGVGILWGLRNKNTERWSV